MPEFIRYTEMVRDTSGLQQVVHYVNLDSIERATYSPTDGKLVIVFSSSSREGNSRLATLEGAEAESARSIIDKKQA